MSGLSFYHAVAQALSAGKLFHIDLNGQKIGRFDQDLRFASEGIKDSFFLVQLLETSGYSGPRHFDAHPYRVEDAAGVWEFAAGCMRTYLILAEKARRFDQDAEIQAALADAGVPDLGKPSVGPYSKAGAAELRATTFDADRLASRGYANERLDQLVIDLLLGMR
jgi:xylose isomerase